jgi:hypothetical protein
VPMRSSPSGPRVARCRCRGAFFCGLDIARSCHASAILDGENGRTPFVPAHGETATAMREIRPRR